MKALCTLLSVALFAQAGAGQTAPSGPWPLWKSYAEHFLSQDGRISDPDREQISTSEGQSYALFFSLVANDQNSFARILSWTENNLAHGDISQNLIAWKWGRNSEGQWAILDPNSAADADLLTAYSLIEAGRLWKRTDYAKKGVDLLSLVATEEVHNVPAAGGPVLLPAKVGFQQGKDTWVLNSSYLPLPVLMAASKVAPHGPWKTMVKNLPIWLHQASPSGFAMDWVACDARGCTPSFAPGDSSARARGSYDAIRVYMWAGMTSEKSPGFGGMLATFAPMLAYLKAHASAPESVAADGSILSATAPSSFQAALIPFAIASGALDVAERMKRDVLTHLSSSTGLLGTPARYYDQNLALFGLGWQEERFRFTPKGDLKLQWSK